MDSQPAAKGSRHKTKNKKPPPKPKNVKKRKTDGPTCSMFLAELTKKLAYRKRQDDAMEPPKNVVQSIVDSISNALPVVLTRKSPDKKESPLRIESLQTLAPELLPTNMVVVAPIEDVPINHSLSPKSGIHIPKMPLVNSDVLKLPEKKHEPVVMEDVAVNTGGEHDVATEIAKHVNTLRKISLIAEEFNQKTAKNLKEIVDSVQEDLIKKLEDIQAEQKAKAATEMEEMEIVVE